ncbi:MAG: ribonuclease R [Cyclobacteriaceae bacterium]|nr:ribonuclease R [Cyclobacteriaceae bacterium]
MSNKKRKPKNTKSEKKVDFLKQEVIGLFEGNPQKSFSTKKISRQLNIDQKHLKKNIDGILLELLRKGMIDLDDDGNFTLKTRSSEVIGQVDFVNSKYAFVVSEKYDQDIYVKAEDLKTALDDDIVKVNVSSVRKDGRPVGFVTEIVKRHRLEFVGRVELSAKYAFVVPDFRKMHYDIFIRPEDFNKAKNNDKVIVRIREWKEGDKNPVGEIINVLGPAGQNEAEIHSIMAEFGLPFDFLPQVTKQADKISSAISQKEIKNRRDYRNVTTFTIDPEDAKDFDDAVSIIFLENGNYEVGVHIADVTHYVQEDSILDKEAFERATSVYLVDRTIPMLPERLSNDLCSLKPREDKLTFSAVFEMDKNAQIKHEWFGKTIIHSDRRFTYEEAQERIETFKGDFAKELTLLNELALKLRLERFMTGSINFETTEVKFRLDKDGKPLEIIPKIRKDAHKLIEDFMLLANKRVAEYVHRKSGEKRKKTFVYRIHDNPDEEKLETFSLFVRRFGHQLNFKKDGISKALNLLMDEIEGKPEQNILENLAIRTMAKAKYSTEEKGHFGLAFDHYTHFTSPIRRYPDMMVHRLLHQYMENDRPVSNDIYEQKCIHSSEKEKMATDAERASIKYKQVEYMADKVGQDFDGLISGVTDWGIYVEIVATKVEGMIRMSELGDDYYEFDEKNMRVVGRYNKRMYTLGDKIKIKVLRADVDRRIIDLSLAGNE